MAGGTTDVLTLSVHGSAGVVDLVVPAEASARDVATAYAEQAGLAAVPALARATGAALPDDAVLADVGVDAGTVLVALLPGELPSSSVSGGSGDRSRSAAASPAGGPGALSVLWFCVASAAAGLAGWFAAQAGPGDLRDTATGLLVLAALLAVLPVGRFAGHRAVAAPAFAGAAAFAVLWDPAPERLPTVVGTTALVAAVAAAVARALDQRSEEALRTWMLVGSGVFGVTVVAALAGFSEQVVWAVLLVAAVLAARLVPGWAVDVPDQLLVDLERLAVTAWSAREQPRGRRGRTIVRPHAVAEVAARGARVITSASVAVLAVAAVSAPLLLATATVPMDRIGARVLVGASGASLLLAARSYRHVAARSLLRAAGLACELALLVHLLDHLGGGWGTTVAVTAVLVAVLLVVVAVATGRGWRSAWWSRRAEVLEGICGSFAVASVVVAVGLFRALWERTF
jgi:hypothetical protein